MHIFKPVNRLPLSKALKEKLETNAILFFSDIVYMGLVDFSKAKQITKTDVNAIIRLCAKKIGQLFF